MQPTKLPRSARSSGDSLVLGDDVGDPDAAAGTEHAGDLGEHGRLVGREVDDAVRDHDVDALGGERDVLDEPLQEVDVRRAGLARVALRELEHLVGHVEAVDGSGRADSRGGEEDVDAAAGAEVEDGLALVEVGDRDGVAAAEAREDGLLGELGAVVGRVEPAADERCRLVAATADLLAVTPAAAALARALGPPPRSAPALPPAVVLIP